VVVGQSSSLAATDDIFRMNTSSNRKRRCRWLIVYVFRRSPWRPLSAQHCWNGEALKCGGMRNCLNSIRSNLNAKHERQLQATCMYGPVLKGHAYGCVRVCKKPYVLTNSYVYGSCLYRPEAKRNSL